MGGTMLFRRVEQYCSDRWNNAVPVDGTTRKAPTSINLPTKKESMPDCNTLSSF
jgi:hypothetical protein